ncbi:MAG: hypothetical protein HXX11_19035 [Desulfuromonadales bacterium]|nr:hypothetical protein [Desulfuromonadales bacterium]
MKIDKPSPDSMCPLCGKAPSDSEIKSHDPFVWSDLCQCYICESCNIDPALEFYEKDSRFFKMASGLLGLDVWECKKRYLLDVMNKTKDLLYRETEKIMLDFMTASIMRCSHQVDAISLYIEERDKAATPDERAEAEKKLNQALSPEAHGIETELPGIKNIGIF